MLAVIGLASCGFAPLDPCTGPLAPGDRLTCPMPGWLDRGYDIEVPAGWDGSAPLPVVLALHGGGGNKRSAAAVTCPDGDLEDPACLTRVAARAGFVVVRPDGTGMRPLRNVRTWNAGGGTQGYNCTSGAACASGVDDIRYIDELLDEVGRLVPVDAARVHATGLSNGGAMSHRLACALPDRIASIAAVGGANQHAAAGGACAASVAVLQIHGTEDPCWTYDQGPATCVGSERGIKVGVAESMEGWRLRNGCEAGMPGAGPGIEEALPDADPEDGTRVTRVGYSGCARELVLLRVDGGGHTWPGGHAYLGQDRIGRVTHDIDSEIIVEFFLAHP